ncbi:bestrophin family ion channel [Chitinophaga sp. YIM B06452]|uniref:bestrophin family protein n=1 Tax=Chitinophaga sp. YIM B06452 TaxID=3082158 RepID=UPI0031FF3CB4
MNAGSNYSFKEFVLWTRTNIYALIVISTIPVILYEVVGWKWLGVPWVPVALVGTGAAFIVGFKNTQTYNRMWEARIIWGGIVNVSRSWGIMVKDFVRSANRQEAAQFHRILIYRHIAWLTALRFQLRESRRWENVKVKPYNIEYRKYYKVPEWENKLADDIAPYIDPAEWEKIAHTKNPAAQIIALQSAHLRELQEAGHIDMLCYIELENTLKDLYNEQGRSERIKNYPYPRQFASINLFFIRLLVVLLPLGIMNEFAKLGPNCVWLSIPFSVIVGWVFTSLEQVGESTENPFEGGPNDIPITAMSRNIEFDLREMLGETELPPAVVATHDILL